MKIFFVATIVGALLVCGGVFFDRCIEDFSEEMLEMCQSLEDEKGTEKAVERENRFMRIYISGPVTNVLDYREKFATAE